MLYLYINVQQDMGDTEEHTGIAETNIQKQSTEQEIGRQQSGEPHSIQQQRLAPSNQTEQVAMRKRTRR